MDTTPIIDMDLEQWIAFRQHLESQVRTITIPVDINPKVAITILSKIDDLYSHIRAQYSDLEAAKDRVDLMVKEVERVGLEGKNEDERKRNAVLAVRDIKTKKTGATLYDVQRNSNDRYTYIRGILDVLINKQNRLITINGLLKLDKDLMVSAGSFEGMINRTA